MIIKLKTMSRTILNGILGIGLEIFAVLLFIFTGFVVCLFWWGMLK